MCFLSPGPAKTRQEQFTRLSIWNRFLKNKKVVPIFGTEIFFEKKRFQFLDPVFKNKKIGSFFWG